MPKPDANLRIRMDLPLDKKTVENQDWATMSLGRQVVVGHWAFRVWAA